MSYSKRRNILSPSPRTIPYVVSSSRLHTKSNFRVKERKGKKLSSLDDLLKREILKYIDIDLIHNNINQKKTYMYRNKNISYKVYKTRRVQNIFDSIYEDIWGNVFEFIDLTKDRNITNLSLVSKVFEKILNQNFIWKNMLNMEPFKFFNIDKIERDINPPTIKELFIYCYLRIQRLKHYLKLARERKSIYNWIVSYGYIDTGRSLGSLDLLILDNEKYLIGEINEIIDNSPQIAIYALQIFPLFLLKLNDDLKNNFDVAMYILNVSVDSWKFLGEDIKLDLRIIQRRNELVESGVTNDIFRSRI